MDVSRLDTSRQILMCLNGHERDANDARRFYASPADMYHMLRGDARNVADELTAAQFNHVCRGYIDTVWNDATWYDETDMNDEDNPGYLSPAALTRFFCECRDIVDEVAQDIEEGEDYDV